MYDRLHPGFEREVVMPVLNLIDSSYVEHWESGAQDASPGTITSVKIKQDAEISTAIFTSESSVLQAGSVGKFSDPVILSSGNRSTGESFRVASVFTLSGGDCVLALTDDTEIFALAFLQQVPSFEMALELQTAYRLNPDALRAFDQAAQLCFTPGALVMTDTGPRPVENIAAGTFVRTKDHGLQIVRWVGETILDQDQLAASPYLSPILLRRNSIAAGVPARDILVSPNHRILLNDWRAELLFGEKEVLATAGSLLNEGTILQPPSTSGVRYIHLMLDRHEIIFVNGIETESFLPTNIIVGALSDQLRTSLFATFPELETGLRGGEPARRLLRTSEARFLLGKSSR